MDEERPVDPVHLITAKTLVVKMVSVNAIAIDWVLVLRLHDDSRDIQVLGILQGFIDPGFQDPAAYSGCLTLEFLVDSLMEAFHEGCGDVDSGDDLKGVLFVSLLLLLAIVPLLETRATHLDIIGISLAGGSEG